MNKFPGKNDIKVEQAWLNAMHRMPVGEAWQAVVSQVPTNVWSPSAIVEDPLGKKEVKLIDWLMENSTKDSENFLGNIAEAYPVLMGSDVLSSYKAALKSEKVHKKNGLTQEFILGWLNKYKEAWANEIVIRDEILNEAVQHGLTKVIRLALECGADPNEALKYIKTKEDYDVLVSAGGSTASIQKNGRGKVFEYIVKRDRADFKSTAEKKKILTAIGLEGQTEKNESSAEYILAVIKSAKNADDVAMCVINNKSTIWSMKNKSGVGILHQIIESRRPPYDIIFVLEKIKKTVPINAWKEVNKEGQSITEILIKKSNLSGVSNDLIAFLPKIDNVEKIADAVMEWSKGDEVNLLCPIDTLKTSFESPKSKRLFFQYLANKNEEMEGSLNSIFSKNWGAWNDSWLPHLKSAKCTILENKYWNDFVLILNLVKLANDNNNYSYYGKESVAKSCKKQILSFIKESSGHDKSNFKPIIEAFLRNRLAVIRNSEETPIGNVLMEVDRTVLEVERALLLGIASEVKAKKQVSAL